MKTCEEHDCVVVYDTCDCPVCELENEKEALENSIDDLEQNIENLVAQLTEY